MGLSLRVRITGILFSALIFATVAVFHSHNAASAAPAVADAEASAPSMTIYNGGFGVVRQIFPLELKSGINDVRFNDTTAHVETESVILRDPSGAHKLQILEQSYRADALSQGLLLEQNEGKVIEFERPDHSIVKGKVIRSGYQPHTNAYDQYGQQYYQQQMYMVQQSGTPIIEVDGKLVFGLPGTPIFPSLGEDTILKPELDWRLRTDNPGAFNAEISYITGGMRWQADYNLVAPEKCGPGPSCPMEMIGWVTFDNQSGKTFQNARIKLMAGDVNKITAGVAGGVAYDRLEAMNKAVAAPPVTEKAFDDFHLYTLQNPVTLRDRETKQVEFIRANVKDAERLYVYDGANLAQYGGWNAEYIRNTPEYGTQSNSKVWIMQQFKNSEANGLGMPLPKGRLRFYRREADGGRLEFTGENEIIHTPKDEMVRVYTGNAFDIVGERKRTDFHVDNNGRTLDESFEIKLRNHKQEAVEVRVVEHMYRWSNWQITTSTFKSTKTDSRTSEFRMPIAKDGEQVLRYTVHYSW